jgi:hypothetical protein
VIVPVLRVLFVAFAFGWLFPGAPAMPCAEAKVTSAAGDRIILPRAPVTRPDQAAAAPAPGSTAPAGAGPAAATATPPPPGSLAGLRRQGVTPAILLSGDLLLLIVALIIVIRERCRRPP